MPLEILPYDVAASSPLYTLLIGTQDLALYGTGSHEAVFNACHQATLAWLAVPRANKVLVGDAGIAIQSGNWTGLNTLTNTSGSGTLRITLTTTGAPAYLWYALQTTPGTFSVSIDGGPASSSISTSSASTNTYALVRLPVPSGTHTFDITTQSGTVSILAMGSPSTTPGPTVLAADIPNEALPNAAGIAAYTADIQANIALLHADGLDIHSVPTQTSMLATTAEMIDATNPNALGQSELATAFAAAITPTTHVADTATTAAASFTTSLLPIGTHAIDILYSGDSKYASTHAAINETIYDGTSTTTLAADAATYALQSPITLTAAVPLTGATGLVVFSDQSGPIGTAWLNQPAQQAAQTILPGLAPGIHAITAQFQGDAQYNGSTSNPVSINVAAAFTTTALTAPATRFVAATPVPLTASVLPASATGTILFADGNTTLGQSQLVSGVATLTTATLAPGIHPLTATYSGNATLYPSQSPTLTLQIDPDASTVAIAPIPATIPYGTPLPLIATVSPTTTTGTVTIADGASTLGQSTLTNAVATITAINLTPGAHTFTPTYSGDANDFPSIGSPVSTIVTRATSSIVLAPIPPSATFGTVIALTASVTPSAATGRITFYDAGSPIAQLPITIGTAAFTTATLAPGSHTVTATYSGDTFRATSTSAALATNITLIPSSISLVPLPATIPTGNPLTLTATLSPAAATGTVLFRDQTLGILGQSPIANGSASLTLAGPAVGNYAITALYSGDINDAPATSAQVTTQVVLTPTTTALTASPSTAAFATAITLTATVNPAAIGSLAFFDGTTLIGNALLSNGTASLTTATLTTGTHTVHATYAGSNLDAISTSTSVVVVVTTQPTLTTLSLAQNSITAGAFVACNIRVGATFNPSGTVSIRSGSNTLASAPLGNASGGFAYTTLTFPAATLGLGSFPLVASYSGDSTHQPSDTSALPVSVTITTIPTATTLTLSSPQIPIQGSSILTASVSASTPTGSIAFTTGGAILATVPLTPSGTATFPFPGTTIGAFPITATYIPTGLFAASTSASQTITVTAPLSATLSPTALSAAAGNTVAATLTLTPLSGFTGPISTSCKTTATFVICSVIPSGTLTTQTAVPVSITVAKTIAAVSLPSPRGFAILALLLPFLMRRVRRCEVMLLSTLLCASILLEGCAEGGNFNNPPPGTQTITVSVTAAGTAIPATLTLNITK